MKNGLKKSELIQSPNLKDLFSEINNHLYAKLKYTDTDTRSRSKEIINLILCKLVDEISTSEDDILTFSLKNGETMEEVHERISQFFETQVKAKYASIFNESDAITLNKELVFLFIEKIQHISLLKSSKDIFSDAFEIFVSKILKDERGQFFTPPNIVKFMVNYLDPPLSAKIIDPACGHGGFLLELKEYLWNKLKDEKTQSKIIENLIGVDKDAFLAKLCKLYLEILGNGRSFVFCEDSLDPSNYRNAAANIVKNDKFDYVITNPPFGAKIPIDNNEILKEYNLGHAWKCVDKDEWVMENKVLSRQPPQVLFVERCVDLLCDGGKMGIVLPEGIFGNPTNRYIWEFLRQKGKILGIISLDQNTFQPYTCNKASILFFEKCSLIPNDYYIDFAIVENVGHDKDGKILYQLNKDGTIKQDENGKPLINDNLVDLEQRMRQAEPFDYEKEQLCFKLPLSSIKNNIFIPNYYTGVEKVLLQLRNNPKYDLYSISDLIDKGIIFSNRNNNVPRGDEIGSRVYGLGDIPFIRTSDIYNWEVNLDSHKKTSEEVFEQYKDKQNIEVGDILLVKDGGPNLIGNTAIITPLDKKIIIQSHIYQIKVLNNDKQIDPYLILYLLNLDIVQEQIKAITFVQGTIASIGSRINDIILPIPKDFNKREEISYKIKQIIEKKIEIRKTIRNLSL